jgi:2-keto-4-pentenoate hydratase/2-oxohepta-3-ene-1,7-dioic acid hydratase in catechol pathway
MKWCRFQIGSHTSHGIVEDDRVTEVTGSPFEAHTVTGTMVPGDVIEVEISGIRTLRNYVVAEK